MDTGSTSTLFFGGTAYLGMPGNESFRQLVIKGMELYGVNHGASRNNNITLDIFSIAEKTAAKRFEAEDAIIVSSGYLAAQLVVQQYFASHQLIYAPETHPALWLGIPAAPKMKFSDWVEQVIVQINSSDLPSLIISNSLNNLIPEIYDFNWLHRIDPHKRVIILVDDSHGIGIVGDQGQGAYSRIPVLPNVQKIVIASMAKALGVDAGLILGNFSMIEQFRSSPVYAGSSPPSPGMLYAFVNSEEIYKNELKKLRMNLRLFTDLLNAGSGLFFINDFPVFLLKDDAAASVLLKNGINISSFPYPDPKGKSLNRIVLSSNHQREDLEILANAINGANAPKG
ncbi:7-keto-8-aminopelargonate synthetase [Daejeonella rubra]|uniref:7-keto-8-aminopelargonate synthetase n=1 Tax=Daejeonella rubra TaxID=990371 RepID=A0A1G9RM08_9SPHI|nr:aminotransferase class I/II-fold pyridoxal phosphate-dependent enzyme [Daejeonella rubra]SDM24286.1 7-keto-8-aminopelargonate synthetase [Daejeonella rubra]